MLWRDAVACLDSLTRVCSRSPRGFGEPSTRLDRTSHVAESQNNNCVKPFPVSRSPQKWCRQPVSDIMGRSDIKQEVITVVPELLFIYSEVSPFVVNETYSQESMVYSLNAPFQYGGSSFFASLLKQSWSVPRGSQFLLWEPLPQAFIVGLQCR